MKAEQEREFLAGVAAIEGDFWSGQVPPGCGIGYWIASPSQGWHMSAVGDDPPPSTEDTGDVTPEKPKPPSNPFYPKSRNPE